MLRRGDAQTHAVAAVPQRRAPLGKRLFWRIALFVARFPMGVRIMKRLRGS